MVSILYSTRVGVAAVLTEGPGGGAKRRGWRGTAGEADSRSEASGAPARAHVCYLIA